MSIQSNHNLFSCLASHTQSKDSTAGSSQHDELLEEQDQSDLTYFIEELGHLRHDLEEAKRAAVNNSSTEGKSFAQLSRQYLEVLKMIKTRRGRRVGTELELALNETVKRALHAVEDLSDLHLYYKGMYLRNDKSGSFRKNLYAELSSYIAFINRHVRT